MRCILYTKPNCKWGNGSKQCDRDDKQDEDSNERRAQYANLQHIECARRGPEDGPRDIWDESQRERAPCKYSIHRARRWVCVRPLAAQEVSQREIDEDKPNNGGPDNVTGAKHVANESSGGKFCRERSHAGDEDSEEEVAFHCCGGLIIPLEAAQAASPPPRTAA